jgi:hypothetical protein
MEGTSGFIRIWLLYNVGVVGGACCALVSDPHVAVVGMSGGSYTLLGINLADLILNWNEKKFRVPTAVMLVTLALGDLAVYTFGNENISHGAHLGGYVMGTIFGIVFCRNVIVERWEQFLALLAITVGIALFGFSYFWCVVQWPPRNIWEEVGWCWARQTLDSTATAVCIRCADQECIDAWHEVSTFMKQPLHQVSISACGDRWII